MASVEHPSLPLRLFVDKERNRVVYAEASGDFVDTIFSFLTFPLGTIIRLTSNNQHPLEIGCINNLYHSVENCDNQVFWNEICKKMLLRPQNPCKKLCQKLKLNVDDTESTQHWMSGSCGRNNKSDLLLSTFVGVLCSRGKVMDEMKLWEEVSSDGTVQMDGVFVKKVGTYLVFDDLRVLECSATNFVEQLLQLGYTDVNSLTLMSRNIGSKEILDLLKQALISKSPLTDVFLNMKNGDSESMCFFTPLARDAYTGGCSIQLKVTVSKKMNKILYAEAEEDFFDFLFNFLTLPLGSILKLLDGNIYLGSMDTLYRSVKRLSLSWFARSSSPSGTPLLRLGGAPQYGCRRQPHDERIEHAVGSVRRPSFLVVTDDLQVTSVTSTSSILFLQKLNVPVPDLEKHVVTIDTLRALNLLGASLSSKAALTNGLSNLLKMSKEADGTGTSFR